MITPTELQTKILAVLTYDLPFEITGQHLRKHLNDRWKGARWWRRWWHHVSTAKFYLTMAQLEDAGMVRGRYRPEEFEGHIIKVRWYRKA